MISIVRSLILSSMISAQVSAMSNILVTGANSGIGLALCKQLVRDHGAKVYLGARNPAKGAAAVEDVKAYANNVDAAVELVVLDVTDDESVKKAAQVLTDKGVALNAIVNNAGRGYAHGADDKEIIDVNLMGTKRVVDAFLPLLSDEDGRIVNVGSGGGPNYVKMQPEEQQKILCSPDITWETIKEIRDTGLSSDTSGGYRISKALVAAYTMYLAKKHPSFMCFCISPGFINTAMTVGMGASKDPEDGTLSLKHCLFEATKEQSGWYFGSDGKRSPLHKMRNPGEPEFDGIYPWTVKQ